MDSYAASSNESFMTMDGIFVLQMSLAT